MKNQLKKMLMQKHLRIICFLLPIFLSQFSYSQTCIIDSCKYDNVTHKVHIYTNCPGHIMRINYKNILCDVGWTGMMDSSGDMEIETYGVIQNCDSLELTEVDDVAARNLLPSSLLPPGTASYTGSFDGEANPNNENVKIAYATHGDFLSSKFPSDILHSLETDTFSSTASFTLDIDGVIAVVHAPAKTEIDMYLVKKIGTKNYYLTEMKKLEIGGGSPTPNAFTASSLPPNTLIRENTIEHSTGVTIIDSSASGVYIQSYFDVKVEISRDGGVNWAPSCASGLMIMQNNHTNIPTISHWGLIILGLLVLSIGIFFILKR